MVIPGLINIKVYKIEIEYKTLRGNLKKREFEVKATNEEEAIRAFHIWVQSFNETFSYRAYLNVKILSVCSKRTELLRVE